MPGIVNPDQKQTLIAAAHPLRGRTSDYDALLEHIGDARLVLLGEATHGTHDFYRERAAITRRLIAEKGFTAIAIEADWPDAYRVNRFVRGASADPTGRVALENFRRFPTWMWRNVDVLEFVTWLREYNAALPNSAPQVGFYGLDLYSMYASIDAVIRYLDAVDPAAAQRARQRYGCFEQFGEDSQKYGYLATLNISQSCEDAAVEQLLDLQRRIAEYAERDRQVPADAHFYAEQNARLVANAEAYYRSMFRGRVSSWNLRDRHMVQTLDALMDNLQRSGSPQKIVVWAHNSHLGDARATEMGHRGKLNVGQLVRGKYGDNAKLIGFSTYTGTVAAASEWGGAVELKRVIPALTQSYEALFHDLELGAFLLFTDAAAEVLQTPRLERAIGVIYRPATERISHYFNATLTQQFDAVIHIDDSRAIAPLDQVQPDTPEPETFPSTL